MTSSRNPVATKHTDEILAKYPDLPSLTLARMLVTKHPLVYTTLNAARCAIRYRRGSHGDKHRHCATAPKPKLVLPKSAAKVFTHVHVTDCESTLVLPDVHIPYHNDEALAAAIEEGRKAEVDCVLLNGDVLDCHMLSKFEKDPEARSFAQERETAKWFLAYLRQEFPTQRIIYRDGNHEDRLLRYVMQKAPELYDETILSITALLNLGEWEIEHVTHKRTVYLGKLPVLHGHEFAAGFIPPVNPARGAFLRAKQSVVVSHHHRTSEHTETALDGSIITTWSTGCLSDLHPQYSPYNSWNHGAAIIEVSRKDGTYSVRNFRIAKGKVLN
jgi:predicted phosphodiesterase